MRRVLLALTLLVVVGAGSVHAVDAFGSVFGTLMTGKAIGDNRGDMMIGVGVADRTSVFGRFTYGLSDFSEGSIKLGLADDEGFDTKLAFGVDYNYQLLDVDAGLSDPFDLKLGGFGEYVDLGSLSVWQIGGKATGSYPFALSNGTTLSPYGSFNVRMEGYSMDDYVIETGSGLHTVEGDSETELKFGLSFGTSWRFNKNVAIFGEFQFDGNEGLFFGLSYGML